MACFTFASPNPGALAYCVDMPMTKKLGLTPEERIEREEIRRAKNVEAQKQRYREKRKALGFTVRNGPPQTPEERIERRRAANKTPEARERQKNRKFTKAMTFREYINWRKSVPCMDCGGVFPPCAMDFDHVRGEKLFSIGSAHSRSHQQVKEEIRKCDIVCANCHRIRTFHTKTSKHK